MILPANAQAHLRAAFESSIPADDVIPPDTRYRMYAERVVRHPLADWQALTVEEARIVFKQLTAGAVNAPPAPQPSQQQFALSPRHPQPELFCPGTPMTSEQTLWPSTLYGLALGDEWITVMRATGGLCRWRAMRGGQTGEGPRSAFDAFVAQMQELVA